MKNVSTIIEQRPQKVRHEFRILLFPETNTKEFARSYLVELFFAGKKETNYFWNISKIISPLDYPDFYNRDTTF